MSVEILEAKAELKDLVDTADDFLGTGIVPL